MFLSLAFSGSLLSFLDIISFNLFLKKNLGQEVLIPPSSTLFWLLLDLQFHINFRINRLNFSKEIVQEWGVW